MKLVKGSGSRDTGACWMSAIGWYEGNEKWTDAPDCVCPGIRMIGMCANDLMKSDEERERLIGPVIFDVVGTRDDSLLKERTEMVIDFARQRVRNAPTSVFAVVYIVNAEAHYNAGYYTNAINEALTGAMNVGYLSLAVELRDLALAMAKVGERKEVAQVREMEELPS